MQFGSVCLFVFSTISMAINCKNSLHLSLILKRLRIYFPGRRKRSAFSSSSLCYLLSGHVSLFFHPVWNPGRSRPSAGLTFTQTARVCAKHSIPAAAATVSSENFFFFFKYQLKYKAFEWLGGIQPNSLGSLKTY